MDSILSSKLSTNAAYRVNAAVEGRSLDECAVVGIGSRIRPYFINSIERDPDVTGLVVFLETPEGELVSRKVRYVPGSPETAAGQTVSGEAASETTGSGADVKNQYESAEDGKYETPAANDGSSPDGNSSQEKEDAVVERSSGSDDDREKEMVYQIKEKKIFSETGEVFDPDDLVVYVSKLSTELPALIFPEKLTIGPYILVLQVLGLEGVLSHFEKLIYYVSDAELALGDIQTYHSGNAERSGVVSPPDSVLMLETKVSADERLEPYIVWYHGKKRLREGPVSDGVDRLLWQAPAQTGFQTLRAEVFPFAPPSAYKNTGGLVKELSLAISSKQTGRRAAGNTGTSQPDSVTRWYQLSGNLSDSLAPQDSGRELKPENDTIITWLPKTGIYGLAAGPGYSYTISGPLFTPDKKLPGRGQFVFRLAVQSSGIIFSGAFTLEQTSQTLKLELSFDTDPYRLILDCVLDNEKQEQKLFLPFSARDEWITAVVDFTAENKEFRTELSLLSIGNGEFHTELASLSDKSAPADKGIVLPGALTGEGVFRIGSPAAPASVLAGSVAEKASADTAAPQTGGNTPASLTGEENRSAAASADTVASVIPALAGAATEKTSENAVPAPVLILDAAAVLFRVDDTPGTAAADPAPEAQPPPKTPARRGPPPPPPPPEHPEGQTGFSVERSASASGTGQGRQPSLSGKFRMNTGRDSGDGGKTSENPAGKEAASVLTGEETDSTEKPEDGDQPPDVSVAETLNLSDPKL